MPAATVPAVSWVPGRGHGVPAEVVADVIRQIEEEHGVCSPGMFLEAARPEASPLHPLFTWDEKRAAEAYRLEEARQIIRSLRVVYNEFEMAAPFAVNVVRGTSEGERRGYVSTGVALANKQLREQVLDQALVQLRAWHRRYKHLKELAGVMEAIDHHLDD